MFTYYDSVNSKRALTPAICQALVILSLPAVGNSICQINIVLFLIFHLKYVNLDKQDNTLFV